MTATLNEDSFDESRPVEAHTIVYGAVGWTDTLDDATLDLLVKTGIIKFHAEHSGTGWSTTVFVSREGKV